MRRAAAISILAIAVLAVSATASLAGLPKVKNPVIKVPTSLAGVKLGMAQDQAMKKWGGTGKCKKTGPQKAYTSCEYKKARNPGLGRAIFGIVPGGGVYTAQISGTPNGETFDRITDGPLLKFKTEEGLRLGDKVSKFLRLYPEATQSTPYSWVVGKPGQRMFFTFSEGSVPRLVAITLSLV